MTMNGRTAALERKTRETEISVKIDLDGSGEYDVKCQIPFLKHMTETLSRYSSVDMTVKASGDDDHHIAEDVAITMGSALRKAVGTRPICRMSTRTVAMDDALVTVSIDLADRPYADIDCPDPLYTHFLRSFAMSSGMTMHTMVMRGFDGHHIIEATFKALGLCMKDALRVRDRELSTKDTVRTK
jgi:imidazoleglycerol-phosphate dehydratase